MKNKRNIKEGVLDNTTDDGWEAKSQLYQLAQYSIELHKMIHDDEALPAWIQTKIAQAVGDISSIKHHLEYVEANPEHEHPTDVDFDSDDDLEFTESASIKDQALDFYTSIKSKINSQALHNRVGVDETADTDTYKVAYVTQAGELRKKKVRAGSADEAEQKCKAALRGCTIKSVKKV